MGSSRSFGFRIAGIAAALLAVAPSPFAQQTPPQPAQQANPDDDQTPPQRRQGAAPRSARQSAATSDPGTTVIAAADRVVVTGMVPIPNVGEGAPYHSPEELTAMADKADKDTVHTNAVDIRTRMCRLAENKRLSMNYPSLELLMDREVETSKRLVIEAKRAKAATEAAEQFRRDASEGKVAQAAVEGAELARQSAIRTVEEARIKYLEAGAAIADFQDFERRGYIIPDVNDERAPSGKILTWSDLDTRADRRRKAGYWQGVPAPNPAPGVHIENIEAHQIEGKRGEVVRITGLLRNDRDSAVSVPDLNVLVFDQQGFVLVTTPIDASGRIPALSAKAFTYDLKPAPDAVARVAVAFASDLAPPPRTDLKTQPGCDAPRPPE